MSQAVKYAVLAVALTALLLTVASIINQISPNEVLNGIGASIQSFLSVAGSFIANVKGAFNYVLGSAVPLNICLSMIFVIPFTRFVYRVGVTIYRFINQ